MKTILLLGGYGFIGTNILHYIDTHLADEYKVIVFDKFARHISNTEFACVVKTYAGDFSDSVFMESIFAHHTIDIVIHSLSTTIPSQSFNACYDVESNLIPTLNLCSAMIKHQVNSIVYISSGGAVYGDSETVLKHSETENVFPISSYGIVKLAIEKYLMQFAHLYGLKPLILRLSNPYGEWHYSQKQGICNVAIRKGLMGEELSIWGDGSSKKDYIYIKDFVDILFQLLGKHVHTDIINVASGQVLSVNEILDMIQQHIPELQISYTESSKYDVSHFELDTTKLQSIIGAYHFTPIQQGLENAFSWTKNNLL